MDLSQHTWYVRWFFWCCRIEDRFCTPKHRRDRGYTRTERYRAGTNLCHFFRTLLLGSLLFALTLALYFYVLFVLVILPLLTFPALQLAYDAFLVLAITAGSVAIAMVILIGFPWIGKSWQAWKPAVPPRGPPAEPRFFRLIQQYYRALKDQICPLIVFKERTPHDAD